MMDISSIVDLILMSLLFMSSIYKSSAFHLCTRFPMKSTKYIKQAIKPTHPSKKNMAPRLSKAVTILTLTYATL